MGIPSWSASLPRNPRGSHILGVQHPATASTSEGGAIEGSGRLWDLGFLGIGIADWTTPWTRLDSSRAPPRPASSSPRSPQSRGSQGAQGPVCYSIRVPDIHQCIFLATITSPNHSTFASFMPSSRQSQEQNAAWPEEPRHFWWHNDFVSSRRPGLWLRQATPNAPPTYPHATEVALAPTSLGSSKPCYIRSFDVLEIASPLLDAYYFQSPAPSHLS